MRQKIIFFGSGSHVISVVDLLKKYDLVLTVTTEQAGKLLYHLKQNAISYLVSDLKDKESIEKIKKSKPTIGILASYGAIVPDSLLNMFPNGILNIHPSLLPKYRGPSPVPQAILSGDTNTGVTIIKLDSEIDHGPITAQEEILISENETADKLLNRLFAHGAEMIAKLIDTLETGEAIKMITQDDSKATFTKKITRDDGFFPADTPPNPVMLDRMIRAYYPWPGVWTEFELYGTKRRIKLLPEGKIQVEGKKIMTATAFVNGYQKEGKYFLSLLGRVFDTV